MPPAASLAAAPHSTDARAITPFDELESSRDGTPAPALSELDELDDDQDGDADEQGDTKHAAKAVVSAVTVARDGGRKRARVESSSSKAKKAKQGNGDTTKAGAPRKGGRLGRLSAMLTGLPLELLTEILAHSLPVTLLRLSRVARVFRNFLMSRSSRQVWIRAFLNDGLPVPFAAHTVFSEPRYASLIWDKECALCGREKIHKVVYRLRARYCEVCLRANLHPKSVLQVKHPGLHPNVWDCTPGTSRPSFYPGGVPPGDFYMESSIVSMSTHLFTLARADLVDPLPTSSTTDPTIDPLLDSSASSGASATPVVTPAPVPGAPPAETPALDPNTRVGQYVLKAQEMKPLYDHDAKMLTDWQADLDRGRSKEKKDHRQERMTAIKQRLLEEGHAEIDIAQAQLPCSPVFTHMDQPYPLTERVWRKIKPLIDAHLKVVKDERECQAASVMAPVPPLPALPHFASGSTFASSLAGWQGGLATGSPGPPGSGIAGGSTPSEMAAFAVLQQSFMRDSAAHQAQQQQQARAQAQALEQARAYARQNQLNALLANGGGGGNAGDDAARMTMLNQQLLQQAVGNNGGQQPQNPRDMLAAILAAVDSMPPEQVRHLGLHQLLASITGPAPPLYAQPPPTFSHASTSSGVPSLPMTSAAPSSHQQFVSHPGTSRAPSSIPAPIPIAPATNLNSQQAHFVGRHPGPRTSSAPPSGGSGGGGGGNFLFPSLTAPAYPGQPGGSGSSGSIADGSSSGGSAAAAAGAGAGLSTAQRQQVLLAVQAHQQRQAIARARQQGRGPGLGQGQMYGGGSGGMSGGGQRCALNFFPRGSRLCEKGKLMFSDFAGLIIPSLTS